MTEESLNVVRFFVESGIPRCARNDSARPPIWTPALELPRHRPGLLSFSEKLQK